MTKTTKLSRPAFQCWAQIPSRHGPPFATWRVSTYDCDDPLHPDFNLQPTFAPRSHRSSHHLWVWVPDLDGWEQE